MISPPPNDAAAMRNFLTQNVPHEAVDYAYTMWLEQPFLFKISRTRSTCLGNYSFRNGVHKITVNHDLNPYQFLITYVHEVAHQRVYTDYIQGRRKRFLPHGNEWKATFKELMQPLLKDEVFPPEILKLLIIHMKNLAASTVRDVELMKVLQATNGQKISSSVEPLLEELNEGEFFVFNRRTFEKLQTRRTRVLCVETASKRKFTISKVAKVKRV